MFNIQKFSLNDGPGIRTVVFLKGCPLRCAWCSNPESQRRTPQLQWKEGDCVGCGSCLAAAPSAPIRTIAGKSHVDIRHLRADSDEGRAAASACPARALTVVGKDRTVEEVVRICLQDRPFYEDSGGGVTLSGGEALVWSDFCLELISRLHEEGIDTCMETEAHVAPETFRMVASHLDHMLVDLKHVDAQKLAEATGASCDLILENLAWALANHADVLVRTPVIPGFNDSPSEACAMVRWLKGAGATRAQLLPFHNFGESKYTLLDMDYDLRSVGNLHAQDLEGYRQVYLDEGIEAFF